MKRENKKNEKKNSDLNISRPVSCGSYASSRKKSKNSFKIKETETQPKNMLMSSQGTETFSNLSSPQMNIFSTFASPGINKNEEKESTKLNKSRRNSMVETKKRTQSEANLKNIYKSNIKFSYMWDLIEMCNKRNTILKEKSNK